MNNDNDLNLDLHDQMSGWLRYWRIRKHLSIMHVKGQTRESICLQTNDLFTISVNHVYL